MSKKQIRLALVTGCLLLLLVAIFWWYGSRIGSLRTVFLGQAKPKKAAVFGKVIEDTVSPEPVKDATVKIARKVTRTDANGIFRIERLPVAQVEIFVEADKHEDYKKVVQLKEGENKANVALSLTPDETMRRFLKAQKKGMFNTAYDYLHPQVCKVYGRKEYIQYHKSRRKLWNIESSKVGKPAVIETWIHEGSSRMYKNVAEIEVSITFKTATSGSPAEYVTSTKAHLVKVGRQWKTFWSPR